ncbi:MAG TPA: DSD1 family PLP-dependent enzyme [Thermohalobaculum sp.]|nr:DSD1 family PLP-dependent enzyme [Thermohalobaculum sp.]
MTVPPPAAPGMKLAEVETPALLIDLDAFERNLRAMAEAVGPTGLRLRPHAKTHKSPVIARRQLALGAVGVCCQKVSEAEVLADGGVDDVLVTNQVVGARKLERLAALARRVKVGTCVDDAQNARDLSAAAVRFGAEIEVLVEIDVGAGRCGVAPGEPARTLAGEVATLPGLRFGGLQAYQGAAQHLRRAEEREAAIARAAELTRQTVALLAGAGLECRTVGGAGTGTYALEAASGVWNELQCGSYVFMDADYARNLDAEGAPVAAFEQALFVLSTVMSQPAAGRAVLDAGLKALAFDSGPPLVHGRADLRYEGASDEHGKVAFEATNAPLRPGDRLLLVPGHCDPTVNLHDWYVAVRGLSWEGAFVEAVWPVAARGAGF